MQQLRRRERARLSTDVYYSAGRVEGRGRLADLSAGGARIIELTQPLSEGDRVELFLWIGGHEPIPAWATVVRAKGTASAAFRFVATDDHLHALLAEFCTDRDQGLQ